MTVEYHESKIVEKILSNSMGIHGVQCRVYAQDIVKSLKSRGMLDPEKEDIVYLKIQKFGKDDVETYQYAMMIVAELEEFQARMEAAAAEAAAASAVLSEADSDEEDEGAADSVPSAVDGTVRDVEPVDRSASLNTPDPRMPADRRERLQRAQQPFKRQKPTPHLAAMKACVYARSTVGERELFEDSGVLPAGAADVRSWCEAQGWDVNNVVLDEVSVLEREQPRLNQLLTADRHWNVLVVDHWSVLSPYGFEFLKTLAETQGRKIVVVNALKEDLEGDTRLLLNDLAARWGKVGRGDIADRLRDVAELGDAVSPRVVHEGTDVVGGDAGDEGGSSAVTVAGGSGVVSDDSNEAVSSV